MKYANITADTLVKTGFGIVAGFIVNSHTSGTLKLYDNTSAAAPLIINTFTFPTGSGVYEFPEEVAFNTGLYADIGGTVDITIIYR
jgi:hypothetical protein